MKTTNYFENVMLVILGISMILLAGFGILYQIDGSALTFKAASICCYIGIGAVVLDFLNELTRYDYRLEERDDFEEDEKWVVDLVQQNKENLKEWA